MNTAKYRSSRSTTEAPLIGLSISYQRDHLLAWPGARSICVSC